MKFTILFLLAATLCAVAFAKSIDSSEESNEVKPSKGKPDKNNGKPNKHGGKSSNESNDSDESDSHEDKKLAQVARQQLQSQ
jgi:hypothetical protein